MFDRLCRWIPVVLLAAAQVPAYAEWPRPGNAGVDSRFSKLTARHLQSGPRPAGAGLVIATVNTLGICLVPAQATAAIICCRGRRVNASAARKAPMPRENAPMKSHA
jgi:hypothetical protein